MNEQSIDIRPETRALKQAASMALARQKSRYHGTELSPLLLLDPNCTELPAALIEDAVLEPVDKVIWLVLMVRACNGSGATVLPTHSELARRANVAARETASRALSILRCRRWLTVCHTSWHRGGRKKGSAYALHAMPLSLADTIYLDPDYRTFLEGLTGRRHARVQKLAFDALGQLPISTTDTVARPSI